MDDARGMADWNVAEVDEGAREIPIAIEALRDSIERLEVESEKLYKRLTPVVSQNDQIAGPDVREVRSPSLTSIGEVLQSFESRVSMIRARIFDLNHAVQL